MWKREVIAGVADRYDRSRLERVGRIVCARLKASPALDRSASDSGEVRVLVRGETPLGQVRVAFDTEEIVVSTRLPEWKAHVELLWSGAPSGHVPDDLADEPSEEGEATSVALAPHIRAWADDTHVASFEVWSRLPRALQEEVDATIGAGHNVVRVEEGRLELVWEEPWLDRSLDGMLPKLLGLHLKLVAAIVAAVGSP